MVALLTKVKSLLRGAAVGSTSVFLSKTRCRLDHWWPPSHRSQPDRTPANTPARASPTQDNATERGATHDDQRKIRSVTKGKMRPACSAHASCGVPKLD